MEFRDHLHAGKKKKVQKGHHLPDFLTGVLIDVHSLILHLWGTVLHAWPASPQLEASTEAPLLQPQQGLEDVLYAALLTVGERKGQQVSGLFHVLKLSL
jgi:hypothetical protein